MIILVDMDGVIANFELGVKEKFCLDHPDKPHIPLEERTTFHVKDQYPEDLQPLVEKIYLSTGFCFSLKPLPGSIESIKRISTKHDLYICTSPLSSYDPCILEKYQWVHQNLGKDWVKKIIATRDKTLVRADYLIDDNPEVKGIIQPAWEHLLYDQPYNRHVMGKKRVNWNTLEKIMPAFF